MEMVNTLELFQNGGSIAYDFIASFEFPWLALPHIKNFILEAGKTLPRDEYVEAEENIWVSRDAKIAPSAHLGSPCIIGRGAEIRHCAFVRGSALIGEGTVVGNSTELKNCILFDRVQVPHYNYVGDSILGVGAHMGAGSITSNVKSDKSCVTVKTKTEIINTGLRKFGAILGDFAEIGCGCVLNPGCVVGANSVIYPLSSVRGCVPPESIYKGKGEIVRRV